MIKLLLVHEASIDLEIKDRFDNQSKILKSKKKLTSLIRIIYKINTELQQDLQD